jgi:putative transposase
VSALNWVPERAHTQVRPYTAMTDISHHRRSIRLPGYDYSQSGAYFVTICTQDRACVFGRIDNGELRPNDAGNSVHGWWMELSNKFPSVETDAFVVMPNHVHGIIAILDSPVGADLCVRPEQSRPDQEGAHAGAPLQTNRPAIGDIVRWFKTMVTNEYIRGVKTQGWPAFRGRLWQRNYYEHVIRNEDELDRIRQYIENNPINWAFDRDNPNAVDIEPKAVWRI